MVKENNDKKKMVKYYSTYKNEKLWIFFKFGDYFFFIY
jgi:hypothetical protein